MTEKMTEKINEMSYEELSYLLKVTYEMRQIAEKRHHTLKQKRERDSKWDWIKDNLGAEVIIKHGTFANFKGTICIEHNQRRKKYVSIKPYEEEKDIWLKRGGWRRANFCCVNFPLRSIGDIGNKDDLFEAQINKELIPIMNKFISNAISEDV